MPITKGYQALVDEAMAQVKTYSAAVVREQGRWYYLEGTIA